MSIETFPQIDLRTYSERYPQSGVLKKLAETPKRGQAPGDWWSDVVDESHAGTLPLDGIVAAYYGVMHPENLNEHPEERGPENARRLTAGTKFALYHSRFGKRSLERSYSGILAGDATALLGHPSGGDEKDFAAVDFGISLTNRKDILRIAPYSQYLIGDEELANFYLDVVNGVESYNGYQLIQYERHAVNTASVVRRLGVEVDDHKVRSFESRLLRALYDVVKSSTGDDWPDYEPNRRDAISLLINLHDLHPAAANECVGVFAGDFGYNVENDINMSLVKTVAEMRSPHILDSLPKVERDLYIAQANVEVNTIYKAAQPLADNNPNIITPYLD